MAKTKIEWADTVWNPTVGCSKVTEGCRNCYAERMANRLQAMGRPEYQGLVDDQGHWTGLVNSVDERLGEPLRWKQPRRVFVNSMSDLFHENVTDWFIYTVFAYMFEAKNHTFMVLTKRPERMKSFMETSYPSWTKGFPRNVWLGVSVEDQKSADERIHHLLRTPAQVRFVSCEPLLGPVDIREYLISGYTELDGTAGHKVPALDWVICGGESGPDARPMHPGWARSLRDQCQDAGVPFFFKQWGEWILKDQWYFKAGKKAAGRLLDGHEWNEVPNGL